MTSIIKYIFIFIFSLLVTQTIAQNAFQSATIIESLKTKTDSSSAVKLLREIALYDAAEDGIKIADLANPANFKSKFLQTYFEKLLKTKVINPLQLSLDVPLEEKELNTSPNLKTWLSANNININTSYNSIINQIKKKSNDSSLVSNSNYISAKNAIDSILIIAEKNYQKLTQKNNTEAYTKKTIAFFKNVIPTEKLSMATNVFEIQNASAVANSLKLPSQNDIVDALAIFLVKRVKQESVIAFVDQLNKNIDKLQPLPCLFKNTAKELSEFAPGQADNFSSITQKAIAIDLASMPDNIANCSFCGQNNSINSNKIFTNFFNDISDGVDLITNIKYYSETGDTTNKSFQYVLKLLNFVNKYYSNIYQTGDITETWLSPTELDLKNDTLLKLSLALVYEKEKVLFDEFLKTRYGCDDLNIFFNNTNIFNEFKTNFKQMLFSLHKLDSYWQSHKSNKKAVVDMAVYKQRIAEVFEEVYKLMKYNNTFPLKDKTYEFYIKAKEAIANKDIQSVVYYTQQLLDILSCYELKISGFKLPKFKFKKGENTTCKMDESLVGGNINQLTGDSSIKINEFKTILSSFSNKTFIAKYSQLLICENKAQLNKGCRLFNWDKNWFKHAFNNYSKKLDDFKFDDISANFGSIKFRPSLHPFMFLFHHRDWKFAYELKKIRLLHKRQNKLESNPDYQCFLAQENKLQNKFSFGSSRRKVSQLLNFFTDIQKTNDSKQLSQIIEKYAEPVQSYRIKRYTNFSFDINAYPGVYVGVETRAGAGNTPFSNDSISKIVSGITAPIGLSFSWALRSKFTCERANKYAVYINKTGNLKSFKGGCFTTSLMIIDIGAVLAYRFSNDTSKALPQKVTFSQFLAPGIHVGYGIPNLPLVIKAGIQYSPQLRTFNNEGGKLFDVYRFGLSVCYDIPLLNITNTNKKLMRSKS